ncbi:hypothetical protein B0H11DRAFT_2257492 [Mycena galericulata]|nr:hypothetical protein B0H11DRAFT_2257492 [Mycena galericulata]
MPSVFDLLARRLDDQSVMLLSRSVYGPDFVRATVPVGSSRPAFGMQGSYIKRIDEEAFTPVLVGVIQSVAQDDSSSPLVLSIGIPPVSAGHPIDVVCWDQLEMLRRVMYVECAAPVHTFWDPVYYRHIRHTLHAVEPWSIGPTSDTDLTPSGHTNQFFVRVESDCEIVRATPSSLFSRGAHASSSSSSSGTLDDVPDFSSRARGITVGDLVAVYEERANCGMYDELADTLAAMGSKALGNVDCPEDFIRHQTGGHSSNIEFRDKEGFEFRTLLIGEVAGSVHGTVMRATGNYFASADFKPIDDTKLNVKDILALTMPTSSTTRLANFYENQTVPLRSAIDHEFGIESAAEPYKEFLVRPWLRSSDEGSGGVAPPRRGKRKLDAENPRSVAASPSTPPGVPMTVRAAPPLPASNTPLPAAADIKIGAFYDPHLLPDYGGPYFKQIKAKLVQLDFYDRLKLGTLVLVSASLHIFVYARHRLEGRQRGKRRKDHDEDDDMGRLLGSSPMPKKFKKSSTSGKS